MIERLESRIAPAALSATGKVLTYTDVDGDLVHVTFTTAMAPGDFTFSAGSVNGDITAQQELTLIDLHAKPAKTGFTLTASVQNGHGDSHANVEYVNGTNVDLGSISIDGDLHQIVAGSAGQVGPGIAKLTVLSMGRVDSTVPVSTLDSAGSILVKSDIANARLIIDHEAGNITVNGSLVGTDQDYSGRIYVSGKTGSLKVGGSLLGGPSSGGATLRLLGGVGSISIGGSVIGPTINGGAQIEIGSDAGTISIKGDLAGKSGQSGGYVYVNGNLGSISVGGSVRGGTTDYTGTISVTGDIGKVFIGHDLIGGDNSTGFDLGRNGSVIAGGKIGSLTIGGVFAAGEKLGAGGFANSGIISAHTTIGAVSIGQIKGTPDHQLMIEAAGTGLLGNLNAIASVLVKGSSQFGTIVAGYETGLTLGNMASSIGSVQVAGDFIASRIITGNIEGGNGVIGDGFDTEQHLGSIINSVKIGGAFAGKPGSADLYYIMGAAVNKLQIGKAVYTNAQLQTLHTFGTGTTANAYAFN